MATVKTRDGSIEGMEAFNIGTSFRGAEVSTQQVGFSFSKDRDYRTARFAHG